MKHTIDKILGYISSRYYHALNNRIDKLEKEIYTKIADRIYDIDKRISNDVAQKLVGMSSVDFNKILDQNNRICILEGDAYANRNEIQRLKSDLRKVFGEKMQ